MPDQCIGVCHVANAAYNDQTVSVVPSTSGQTPPLTFLFTDVEGSVQLWAADVAGTARSFELHDDLIQRSVQSHQGTVFGTAGDSFRAVFTSPTDALAAAVACQVGLKNMQWSAGPRLRVRMGIHHGPATRRDDDYFGPVPNTAARVEAIAHGGQILITDDVESALHLDGDKRSALQETRLWLGQYRLRDVRDPVGIHQVGGKRFPSLRHINSDLSSLPKLGPPLVGRHNDVPAIRDALRRSNLVTLTGYGGSGKTRLALEVAHQELPSRRDGCYFVDLSSVGEQEEIPAAIAAGIRLTLESGDPIEQILSFLERRDVVVVLDNCEHLVESCADFAEALLARCDAKLLVTSRQRLGVAGERVILVSPLEYDSTDSPAVQLFLERSEGAVLTPSSRSDQDLAAIQEICRRLDGIPLAIELAAARATVLNPTELLERIQDGFRLLSADSRGGKHRTLAATLDWSYGLLSTGEQLLLQSCGVFSGSFDLDAVSMVSGLDEYQTLDLLQALMLKSLISPASSGERTRFRLLETVRDYALNRLEEGGQLDSIRAQHLGHFRSLTKAPNWIVAADIERGSRLEAEWPNISAALDLAVSNHDWMAAAQIAFGCHGLWEHRSSTVEGRRWITQILEGLTGLASEELSEVDQRDVAIQHDQLTMNLALLAVQLDDAETMYECLQRLDETSFAHSAAQGLGYRAFTRLRHDPIQADELAKRALALISHHDLSGDALAPVLWAQGVGALYSERFTDGLPLLEASYAAAQESDSPNTLSVIAGLACAANLVMLDRAQDAIDVLDSGRWESVWDSSPIIRACALVSLGRVSEAAELVVGYGHNALLGRLARQSNDALVGLATLAHSRGEDQRAWKLLVQAVTPRTPATMCLAEHLADVLGHGPDLRDLHRNRVVPVGNLDASGALRDELRRLGGDPEPGN